MTKQENGRKEHRRLETGVGRTSCLSAPLILIMNLLLQRQRLISTLKKLRSHSRQICALVRQKSIIYSTLLFSYNLVCAPRNLCFQLLYLTLQPCFLLLSLLDLGIERLLVSSLLLERTINV